MPIARIDCVPDVRPIVVLSDTADRVTRPGAASCPPDALVVAADSATAVWVLMGALANTIVPQFGLNDAEKGLLVAVPAVWAYNYFTNKVEAFDVEMDNSSMELINYFILRRGARK